MHPLLDFLLKTRSICFHRYIRNKEENDKGENRWEPILSIRIHRSAVTRWTLECGDKPSVKSSWPFECSSGLICSRSVRAVPWTFYFTYSRYVMASTSELAVLGTGLAALDAASCARVRHAYVSCHSLCHGMLRNQNSPERNGRISWIINDNNSNIRHDYSLIIRILFC